MTPEQFAYWLQGIAETNPAPPTAEQWQIIRDHLALMFEKATPDRSLPLDLRPSPPPGYVPKIIRSLPGNDIELHTRKLC